MLSSFFDSGLLAFILESSTVLATCALVYLIFLKNLTHYAWQRSFLLLAVFFSLIVALVQFDIETIVYQPLESAATSIEATFSNDDFTQEIVLPAPSVWQQVKGFLAEPQKVIALLFWSGVAIFLARFSVLLCLLILHTRKAPKYDQDIFLSERFPSAFAFFRSIYLPPHFLRFAQPDLRFVIDHERTHARLGHSFDSVVLEALKPIFWYNPLYWWMQAELKRVHEFQVDAMLASDDMEGRYSELLVKLTSDQRSENLIEPFSMHSLKQRIQRIHQPKSSQMKKAFFLLLLPIVSAMFYAFSIRHTERTVFVSPPESTIEATVSSLQFVLPIAPENITRTSSFGMRKHPISKQKVHHKGLDLVAPMGTKVMATANGTIKTVRGDDSDYGMQIIIEHPGGYTSRYAHLSKTLVTAGTEVSAGEIIGLCGSTGVSTGPHLHFELQENGKLINPEEYLPSFSVAKRMNIDKSSFTVVIDPGHGGKDPGANQDDVLEKELCLSYALALKSALKAKGFNVVMTREEDAAIELADRAKQSETAGEKVFLSIHFNTNKGESGIETFIASSDNAFTAKSQHLAESINTQIANSELNNLGTKSAGFYILKNVQCPVVMLELGSMLTEKSREQITSEAHREKVAQALAKSIEAYIY